MRAEIPDPPLRLHILVWTDREQHCPPLCCHPCVRYWACRCPRARAGIADPGCDFTFQVLATGRGKKCACTRVDRQGATLPPTIMPSMCSLLGMQVPGGLALQIQVTISRSKFSAPGREQRLARVPRDLADFRAGTGGCGIADPGYDFTFQVLATGGQVHERGLASSRHRERPRPLGKKIKKSPGSQALSESLSTLWDSTIQAWHYKL